MTVSTSGVPKVSRNMWGACDMNRTVSPPHEGHGRSCAVLGSMEKSVAHWQTRQARSYDGISAS